jgi:hypothetical protein
VTSAALEPARSPARAWPPAALLLAILFVGRASAADWNEYRAGRLNEFASGAPAHTIVLSSVAIRAELQYSGQFRPLSSASRQHLGVWADAMGLPNAPAAFAREVKVIEGGIEYWLPVQDVLVEPMEAELKPGDEMEAFVVFIGASAGQSRFLLNEFHADRPFGSR